MKNKTDKSFKLYLEELCQFQKQAENLDVLEFEEWKENLLKELDGNYKNRFSNLEFYTITEKPKLEEGEVPF